MHFNSRPSARGDGKAIPRRLFRQYFNSRPSARGDHLLAVQHANQAISIHAPPRGATNRGDAGRAPQNFNSRPSARGDARQNVGDCIRVFQFTPLREGRPRRMYSRSGLSISIHAPPRGATLTISLLFCACPFQFTPLREGRRREWRDSNAAGISIHAPPRGATCPASCRSWGPISIHAPPRGATGVSFSCLLWLSISIHAPPRGATKRPWNQSTTTQFQFTPLREGRRRRPRTRGG